MNAISQQRCFHHLEREAAARCPRCTRFYCRECVTEHDDAVVCAFCLRLELADNETKPRRELGMAIYQILRPLGGFLLVWLIFWAVGQGLLMIPSSFHEGTVWDMNKEED